jgi:tripartite-type tricarboxylate transporter receptor subunit TctC
MEEDKKDEVKKEIKKETRQELEEELKKLRKRSTENYNKLNRNTLFPFFKDPQEIKKVKEERN